MCVCVCVLGCMTIMVRLSPLSLLKVKCVNEVIEIHSVISLSALVSVYTGTLLYRPLKLAS